MSRLIAELLGAEEPGYSLMIRSLEQASGLPSEDVRLATEVSIANQRKMQLLQLDATDTTGPELYHALQQLLRQHDEILVEELGGDSADGEALLRKLKHVVQRIKLPKRCRAIKPAAAKRLLKSMPPKRVMKQLGYRSVDSMLKRENIAEIFSALNLLESTTWRKRFIAQYQNLGANDFEDRDIEILILSPTRWGESTTAFIHKERHNLICTKEMGSIAVLPLPSDRLRGVAITMVPLIVHCMQKIRTFSVFCKLHHMRADFGRLAWEAVAGRSRAAAVLAGNPLSWQTVQRHFGGTSKPQHLHVFGPHIQPADLEWRPVGETVASIHKDLDFWHEPEYLGAVHHDGVVSYNLLDAAINYCNNVPYHKRFVYYMRSALLDELYTRYLRQPHIEQDVIRQMETNLTT